MSKEMELEEMLLLKEEYLEELEAKNAELEKKLSEAEKMVVLRILDLRLEKKLKIALEALEFYGDKENWQAPEDQGFEHHDTLDNSLADMIHEDHDKKTGGKRAREALAAINREVV